MFKKGSGKCFTRLRRMLQKISGSIQEDSGEYFRGVHGMLLKIPGNIQEYMGKAFHVLLKIKQILSYSFFERCLIVAISNETIERQNKVV